MYIFICIGTTKVVGDSLGPLIGSRLKEIFYNNRNIKVYGDIEDPIDYYSINKVICEIESKYENCIKIIIDSALGNKVGTYIVSNGDIILGHSLNKSKIAKGDINIIATVGRDHKNFYKNLNELKNTDKQQITQMAEEISKAIKTVYV